MRVILLVLTALALSACQVVYKLPTRQGNVIEQKQLDQLKTGMTRQQVTYLMGTPIAASPFRTDRWDYVGYYKSPRGQLSTRTVTLYFDKDTLTRMEGIALPDAGSPAAPAQPDAKAIYQQQKKEKAEDERAKEPTESGVIISPPPPTP